MKRHKVILRHCDAYDPARIADIIGQGMDELGVHPSGRTLVKPNVVIAHRRYWPHAFTRPEFLDGLLSAVKKRSEDITELRVGERCGITIPTRYAFACAGYPAILRKHRVPAEYFDEGAQLRVDLKHPDALRDFILVPEGIVRSEFLINAPKFKTHPWTKVTFSLKNFIGIQHDPQRLIDHDHMLHTKIADLQEVIAPGFIAIDGIVAGEGPMLTPKPFPLNLIVMGINPVAVDVVCTHVARLDPGEVDHIRIAAERGYGPLSLEQIEISGDIALEEARERTRGIHYPLERLEEIFNHQSNIMTYVGPPPDTYDYCWGGCPGSLYEAIETMKGFQPNVRHEIRPMHYVIGAYQGEISPKQGERVIFMGDCARWEGQLSGEHVRIPFLYQDRQTKNPYQAKSGDVVTKMVSVLRNLLRHRGKTAIRVRGCPVSVAENVLYAAWVGKVVNPYFHPRIIFQFIYYWWASKFATAWRSLKGLPQNKQNRARIAR